MREPTPNRNEAHMIPRHTTIKECPKCIAQGYPVSGPTTRTHCAYCNTPLVEVTDND